MTLSILSNYCVTYFISLFFLKNESLQQQELLAHFLSFLPAVPNDSTREVCTAQAAASEAVLSMPQHLRIRHLPRRKKK